MNSDKLVLVNRMVVRTNILFQLIYTEHNHYSILFNQGYKFQEIFTNWDLKKNFSLLDPTKNARKYEEKEK